MSESLPKKPRTPSPPVTVNLIDVLPVAEELRRLTSELSRTNWLLELVCRANNIPTRDEVARPQDLAETSTGYGADPEFEAFVVKMEREAGRPLTEAESAKVFAAWQQLEEDVPAGS